MKVVFLNGPPRSGKDTGAEALRVRLGARVMKFASPIEEVVKGFFGLELWEYNRFREKEKEVPQPRLLDHSMRKVMISVSEDWAKPTFGPDVFGRLAAGKLLKLKEETPGTPLVVFSDCGFAPEVRAVAHAVGAENCFLIRLGREGCSYAGDSRGYVFLEELESVRLINSGTGYEFGTWITSHVQNWLKETSI